MTTCLCLSNQGRARKERDPYEFSFHDLISFSVLCFEKNDSLGEITSIYDE